MPARIETHAALGIGQHLDPLGIKRIETGVGEHLPMGGEQVMQTIELALAGKIAGGIGKGLETLEKIAKSQLEAGFQHVAVLAEKIAEAVVQAGKTQPVAQAACLCVTRPI